jgi:hypothetical protein
VASGVVSPLLNEINRSLSVHLVVWDRQVCGMPLVFQRCSSLATTTREYIQPTIYKVFTKHTNTQNEQHHPAKSPHSNNNNSSFPPMRLRMSGQSNMIQKITSPPTSTCTAEGRFPGKLHDMLDFADSHGLQHIISWTPDGRAFVIHDTEKLVSILPLFFSQTKYRSFHRQVSVRHRCV